MTEQHRDDLTERLAALPRQRQPRRDLWPGIAEHLQAASGDGRRGFRWQPWALAASLLITLAVGYQIGLQQPAPSLQDSGITINRETLPPVNLLQGLAREYQGAIRELTADNGPASQQLPANTEQEVADTLEELRFLAKRLRDALQEQPANANLAAWLVRVEATQFRVLQQVAQVEEQPRRMI